MGFCLWGKKNFSFLHRPCVHHKVPYLYELQTSSQGFLPLPDELEQRRCDVANLTQPVT